MQQPRVRLRTMMTAVAFIALALAVVVQSVRLQQARVREQQIRAQLEIERYHVMIERQNARKAGGRARAVAEEYRPRPAGARAGEPRQPPPAAPEP